MGEGHFPAQGMYFYEMIGDDRVIDRESRIAVTVWSEKNLVDIYMYIQFPTAKATLESTPRSPRRLEDGPNL